MKVLYRNPKNYKYNVLCNALDAIRRPKKRSLSGQVLLETRQNPLLGILWRDGQAAVLNQAANVARICVE